MQNYTYDGKFQENILIAGRTECRKETFIQTLALNNFFGKLKKAEWVSYVRLTKKREAEVPTNFSCASDFWYPGSIEELDDLLEELKKKV